MVVNDEGALAWFVHRCNLYKLCAVVLIVNQVGNVKKSIMKGRGSISWVGVKLYASFCDQFDRSRGRDSDSLVRCV